MKISEVADQYQISKRTLRYYEEIGLLESSRENQTQQRVYDKKQIHQLEKILILKKIGISLNDIKFLVEEESNNLLEHLNRLYRTVEEDLIRLQDQKELLQDSINIAKTHETNLNFYELIKERIYMKHYTKEIKGMKDYMKQLIIVEFGEGLIEEVIQEKLVEQVSTLKNKLQTKYDHDLPLIRMRDNLDLDSKTFRIVIKDITVIHQDLTQLQNPINTMIALLEDTITNNINLLIQ